MVADVLVPGPDLLTVIDTTDLVAGPDMMMKTETRDRSVRRERPGGRKRTPSPKRKSPTPQPTEDERDRRTVFVQQLAARLRTKELITFFEKVGPVKEAQIVKDRVSGRSKG